MPSLNETDRARRWFRATFSPLADAHDCAQRLRQDEYETETRVSVVADKAGKLRGITLHKAELVAVSRCMTKHLLANLKMTTPSRAVLEAQPVELRWRGTDKVVGYSADLSAATDHIGNELAEACLRAALLATNAPDWLVAAVPAVCSRIVVATDDGDRRIRCGALMGLGPGWITLSLANSYAAMRAGAKTESFAVCGDDLVGLWPARVADAYERTIAKLGLVANVEKSYRGTGAVFCEQFGVVVPAHDGHRLRLRPQVHLAEASGAESRVQGKPLDAGLGQVDSLRDIAEGQGRAAKPIRRLAARTASRLALKGRGILPGRVRDGGGGYGPTTVATLRSYLVGGGAPTVPGAAAHDHRARRVNKFTTDALEAATARKPGHATEGMTVSEFRAEAARTAETVESLSHVQTYERKGRLRVNHTQRSKQVNKAGRMWELLHSDRALTNWTAQARARCWRAFRRARFATAIQSLRSGERTIIATEVHALHFSETNVVSLRRVASPPLWVPGP
jgi:hypothetical protein